MKHTILSLTLCGLAGAGVAAEVYENDFTTRTSKGPVQTGEWYTFAYAKDVRLAKNIDGLNYASTEPWTGPNLADTQDNWRKLANTNITFGVYCRDDNGNQYGEFMSSAASAQGRTGIIQPFYNSITDGVLRVQADLKQPATWGASGSYIRVQPLARKHLSNTDWSATGVLFNFGLQAKDNTSQGTPLLFYGAGKIGGDAAIVRGGSAVTGACWFRVVGEVDLATGKLTFYWAKLGDTHPTLDADVTLTKVSGGPYYLRTPMSEANGPIEGLAVVIDKISNSGKVAFDNLVCEWKKPGGTTFERFYENDLTTRRYRTIAPAGETSYDYTVKAVPVTKECWAYKTGYPILATAGSDDDAVQPMGMDGWRRCNRVGTGTVKLVAAATGDDGGVKLAATHNSDTFVNASQTLGTVITSGTLKASCDFRLPNKWTRDSLNQVFFVLGGDVLYKGTKNQLSGGSYTARVGITAPANNDKTKFLATWSNGATTTVRDTTELTPNRWYRVVVDVNKDANTYGFKLYKFGTTSKASSYVPTAAELVCEKSGLALTNTDKIPAINSFSLWTYGAGTTEAATVYFDSIQFWKDGSSTPLYQYIGQKSVRNLTQVRGEIVGDAPQVDYGQDHWIRRNCGAGKTYVTAGENPCLAGDARNSFVIAVQSLGKAVKRGTIEVQADIRPPRVWTWDGSASAGLYLGGDTYLQGIMGTNSLNKTIGIATYALNFGFGREDKTKMDSYGYMNDVKICYQRGTGDGETGVMTYLSNAITKSHWHRFRASVNVDTHTYDLSVYDMGEMHPTAATPKGVLIATVKDIPFRWVDTEISSIGLNTYGVAQMDPADPEDVGLALYDNVVVSRLGGLSILVR